jgi:hypothetical protein
MQEEKVNMIEQSSTEARPAAEALLSLVQHRQGGLAAALPELTALASILPASAVRWPIRDHFLRVLRATLFRTEPAARAAQGIAAALTDTQDPDLAGLAGLGCEYDGLLLAILALTDGRGMGWRQIYDVIRTEPRLQAPTRSCN